MQATPAAGAAFTSWLGPCAGQGNPCTLTLSQYTPVGADFASPVSVTITGAGSVVSSPAGINCTAGTCSGVFNARTLVTLTATSATGNAFNGWGGDCTGSGSNSSCALNVNGSKSIAAQFVDHRTLSVGFTGSGSAHIVSAPAGIDCGAVCTASFPPGSTLTLTAVPAADSYLVDWGIQGCLNYRSTCSVTLNGDTTQTITLALKPTLSLTVTGDGSVRINGEAGNTLQVTCTSSCTEFLDPDALFSLTATGTSSTYFATWGGDCGSGTGVCYLSANSSKTVGATFSPRINLTASTAGSGQGTISSSDGQLGCPSTCVDAVAPGTPVTVYANAATNSVFAGWSGACTGTQTSCALTVNSASSVTATFNSSTPVTPTPPVTPAGHSGGGALDLFSLTALAGAAAARIRSRRQALRRIDLYPP